MMWLMVWMLFFWLAVAGGVVWLFTNRRRSPQNDALEALRQRLARGEIEIDEFRQREDALKRNHAGLRPRGVLIAFGFAIAVVVFVVVPAIVLATNGWDMWDMHGRGRSTSGSSLVRGGSQATVNIEDFAFEPGNVEVPIGATVTWTNRDSAPHDATSRDGSWETETLSSGESGSATFDAPGEFDYYCTIHPSMKAHLSVK